MVAAPIFGVQEPAYSPSGPHQVLYGVPVKPATFPNSKISWRKQMFRMNPGSLATFAAGAAALAAGLLFQSPAGKAQQSSPPPPFDAAKSLKGFQIAPVPLNMQGRDPYLVGYGSYLVNAVGDCNGCHSAGPATEFVT